MRIRMALLSLLALCLTLVAFPAMAQTVYSNGPINGNVDSWDTYGNFIVSDTFNLTASTTITGVSFGMWLTQTDTLLSAELSITSNENGGTSYFDQTVNFTQGRCTVNNFGSDVCMESTSFSGPSLNVGTYWLNLHNAQTLLQSGAYWDENSGPSLASESFLGTIPSEAFTVLGSSETTTTTSTSTSVPEPSSIILFGSGILGLSSLIRRKLS